jgi:hypothetical protein
VEIVGSSPAKSTSLRSVMVARCDRDALAIDRLTTVIMKISGHRSFDDGGYENLWPSFDDGGYENPLARVRFPAEAFRRTRR